MASTSRPKKPQLALAAVVTLLAFVGWATVVVLTAMAWADGGYKPVSSYPESTVKAFILVQLALTAIAWLLTRPSSSTLRGVCGFMRIATVAILAAGSFAVVLGLGPEIRPERAVLLNVWSAFSSALLAIGVPAWINLVQPLRRRPRKGVGS